MGFFAPIEKISKTSPKHQNKAPKKSNKDCLLQIHLMKIDRRYFYLLAKEDQRQQAFLINNRKSKKLADLFYYEAMAQSKRHFHPII
jgi:hypothetical protein